MRVKPRSCAAWRLAGLRGAQAVLGSVVAIRDQLPGQPLGGEHPAVGARRAGRPDGGPRSPRPWPMPAAAVMTAATALAPGTERAPRRGLRRHRPGVHRRHPRRTGDPAGHDPGPCPPASRLASTWRRPAALIGAGAWHCATARSPATPRQIMTPAPALTSPPIRARPKQNLLLWWAYKARHSLPTRVSWSAHGARAALWL